MRPIYVGSILFLCAILLSWAFSEVPIHVGNGQVLHIGDGQVLYASTALYTIAYFAVVIFLLTLAWRATKALEKAAEEQKNTAYFLRELVMQKSKEEKKS